MRGHSPRTRRPLIGRDVARTRSRPHIVRNPWFPAALVGLLFGALALTALREEIIEVRYEIFTANEQVSRLSEVRARLIARVQQLRDPRQLTAQARELGFERPELTIDLRPVEIADAGLGVALSNGPREGRSR